MSRPRQQIIATLLLMIQSAAAQPAAEQIEFFETKIRPLFVEHCYSCHSDKAEKVKGGLRLDSPEALLKGGTTGPAFVAHDPEASLLIKAVRYTDADLQMPPKDKKLAADQIASLEAWVKIGAPLPSSTSHSNNSRDIAHARASHWAFKPVQKAVPPQVKKSGWVKTPVDNFILATLEKRRLQ